MHKIDKGNQAHIFRELPECGVYVLEMGLKDSLSLTVGALGLRFFPPGTYFYVGSAQKGLKHRLSRHLTKDKKAFWHIDYLLEFPSAQIRRVFSIEAKKSMECLIARMLADKARPVEGFGASDCSCRGHLLYTPGEGHEAKDLLRDKALDVLEF